MLDDLLRRLLRVLVATVGAFVLSFPLVAVTASDSAGFGLRGSAPFVVAGIVAAVGVALTLLLLVGDALRPSVAAHALSDRSRVRAARAAAVVVLVALAALPLLGVPDKYRDMTLETLVYVTIAVGLNITIGMAGLLVLGHAAFWAVGAYAFTLTTVHWHWNFWLAFPAAGVAAAAAGFVIGLPALRLRGDYLAVVTLGFGEAVRQILTNESSVTGGDVGVPGAEVRGSLWEPQGALGGWLWQPGVGANGTRGVYWFALVLAAACVASVSLLARSRLGRALYALREDETAARCMGIDTVRVKLVAFMSSAFWAGLAGTATAVYRGSISPGLFNFEQSVLCVAMVVLGGLGSIAGAVLGAVLLYALPLFLQDWVPEAQNYRLLVFGAVMVGMMVVRPTGLLGRPAGKGAAS